MNVSSGDAWDFFISFAQPDQARAEDLGEQLEQQGGRVFLAQRSIEPGTKWSEALDAAIRGSRVFVALLSERTAKAHYQQEEIELALELAKTSALAVVPVYLEGKPAAPASWELGLRSFHGIDLRQKGLADTARALARKLSPDPASPASVPGRAGPPDGLADAGKTVGDVLHGAALRIDRAKQWQPLVEICLSTESAFFLLHGPEQQNLDLFVTRILSYLPKECGHDHRMYVVPLQREFAKPRTAAAWENHLRFGLAGEGERGGTAEDLLHEAARAHPVFLVLSRRPISPGDLDEDAAELDALEELLGDRLPALIAGAARDRHPIRALLATHYERLEDSLVDRLDERAEAGCRRHGVRYRKLAPLAPLEWIDVEDFLEHFSPRPPKRIYKKLRAAFEELDQGTMQFRDVVDLLSRVLD